MSSPTSAAPKTMMRELRNEVRQHRSSVLEGLALSPGEDRTTTPVDSYRRASVLRSAASALIEHTDPENPVRMVGDDR